MVAAVLVPSVVSFIWFSVFGGTALWLELYDRRGLAASAGESKALVTFEMFGSLPMSGVISVVIVLAIGLLFITSADSASFMLGSTTYGGSPSPPKPLRLMWAAFGASFAAVLLLDGRELTFQGAAVVGAVPFTAILVCLCIALGKSLLREVREEP